jgi:hypothetical protein
MRKNNESGFLIHASTFLEYSVTWYKRKICNLLLTLRYANSVGLGDSFRAIVLVVSLSSLPLSPGAQYLSDVNT